MTNVARRGIALLGLALALFAPAARASDPVDLPLGLAADVSRSVTERKFKLQREGAAAAITHPRGAHGQHIRPAPGGPRYRHKADDAAPYETITIDKLTPIIGAEIGGVDLSRLLL